jgi:hypothetical protein
MVVTPMHSPFVSFVLLRGKKTPAGSPAQQLRVQSEHDDLDYVGA